MIELNLLPLQERELLDLEQARRWITFYGVNFLFIIGGFIVLLGFIWFFILVQLKSYTLSIKSLAGSFQGQSVNHEKQTIGDFNKYLEKINRTQKSHKYHSLVLAELSNIMPSGVRLDALSIDGSNQVTIAGFAQQRTQVLLLREALAKSSLFTEVDQPLANLTKQIDITFNFSFGIKTEKIIK